MIKKKRADVINAVMDQSAIGAAAVPQADRKAPPTLSGAYKLPPMSGPMAPRQSMGGPLPQGPRDPGSFLTKMIAAEIAHEARRQAAVGVDPNTNRGPVTGVRGGEPVGFDDYGNKVGGGVCSSGKEGSGDFGSGIPKPFPTSPARTTESEQDKIDREIRDFVRSRIGAANNVDTTEEEALITRQMEGKLGEGIVYARARGGRDGFGEPDLYRWHDP
jgi:hypothetical protein